MQLNKVYLYGNLTRNPELRYTPSQMAVCDFGIAVNTGTQDKQETYWGEIVCFGKMAESVSRHTQKGTAVFVEGKLKTDTWNERDSGQKRTKTRIIADRVQFMGGSNRRQE